MPAVAVASAVWGGAALAAGATGFAAVAAIGAVAAGVGVVTGNGDLTKIGSALGIIGGIGAVASGQGLLTAGEGAAGASTASPISADAVNAGEAASGMWGGTEAGAVAQDAFSGVLPEVAPVPVVEQAAAQAGAAAPSPLLNAAPSPVGSAADTITAAGKSAWDSLKDIGAKMGAFAEKQPAVAWGAMQVGGNLIGGLFDPLKEVQKDALLARADLDRAQQEAIMQRTATTGGAVPMASVSGTRAPVFGNQPAPVYNRPMVAPSLLNGITGNPA